MSSVCMILGDRTHVSTCMMAVKSKENKWST